MTSGSVPGDTVSSIAERAEAYRARLGAACERAERSPVSITTVVVTKTHPPSVLRAAMGAGFSDIGESRVQDMLAKMESVAGARWHLVGRLQRNKVVDVIGRAVLVHGVDRRSLVDELERRAADRGLVQRILIQVNVGEDPAKAGCPVDRALDLVAYARDAGHLAVEGLMTIPPIPPDGVDPNEHAEPFYARLRDLRDEARAQWSEVAHLSMGMSADLEAAVSTGATIVRVGTALLGPRRDPPWVP